MSEERNPVGQRSGRPTSRVAVLTRLSWLAILGLTATFHFLRGAPADGWIYLGGAAVLALDALGWLRVPLRLRTDRDTLSRRVIAGVLIAVASITLAFTPLFGDADTTIVVGLGVLLLPVVWADRATDAPTASSLEDPAERAAVRRAAYAWSAVIVIGCVWEVGAFFLGRSSPGAELRFPALSDLVDPLVAWPVSRAVLVALWLLGGYALVRRGRTR